MNLVQFHQVFAEMQKEIERRGHALAEHIPLSLGIPPGTFISISALPAQELSRYGDPVHQIHYEINFYDHTGEHPHTQAIEVSVDFEYDNNPERQYPNTYDRDFRPACGILKRFLRNNSITGAYREVPFFPAQSRQSAPWGRRIINVNKKEGQELIKYRDEHCSKLAAEIADIFTQTYDELHKQVEKIYQQYHPSNPGEREEVD